jgi:hypothetical protein
MSYRYVIIALIAICLSGCQTKLPENYGVYCSGKSLQLVNSQKIKFNGNILETITGLAGPSGVEIGALDYLIVFEKDLNPKQIKLVKLSFQKFGTVQNIMGPQAVETNLWVASQNIEFDVTPIEGKKNMFKIIPKTRLANGFYALHYGGLDKLSAMEAANGNNAYDFVIGSKGDYLSHESQKAVNSASINSEADKLLLEMNKHFNAGNFEGMKEIYRPQGRILAGPELAEFIKGQKTWKQTAGTVIESEIVTRNITDDTGVFEIETKYSSKGVQKEKLVISKTDGKFIITSLE